MTRARLEVGTCDDYANVAIKIMSPHENDRFIAMDVSEASALVERLNSAIEAILERRGS